MAALCLLLLVIFIHLLPFDSQAKKIDLDSYKCVKIHKQPAFRHPKLKHHKLQTVPNIPKFPAVMSRAEIMTGDGCPQGKVPIHKHHPIKLLTDKNDGVQFYATLTTIPGDKIYRGGAAVMGVYHPPVTLMQSSRANIWVQNGPLSHLNSIEAGWAVHPNIYYDNSTRLTAYWTIIFTEPGVTIYYVRVSCKIDSSLFLGKSYSLDAVHPELYEQIGIFQDNVTGNWWLVTQMELIRAVGYWPNEIFNFLSKGADVVKYGGVTSTYLERLDRPPMGSGRYPEETGWTFGFFTRIRYVDDGYHLVDAERDNMVKHLDSVCYGLLHFTFNGTMKEAIKFGGPGGTPDYCYGWPHNIRLFTVGTNSKSNYLLPYQIILHTHHQIFYKIFHILLFLYHQYLPNSPFELYNLIKLYKYY